MVAPTSDDELESFHDEYTLTAKLGHGSFAAVYLVQRIGDSQKSAVKVSDLRKPDEPHVDLKKHKAFMNEIRLLQLVSGSQQIVQFIAAYVERGYAYLVMEKCDASILQVLDGTPELTERSIRRVFREMFKALAAIHAASIVHRDVKPDNFLCVGQQATVKLCDFGLAAQLEAPLTAQRFQGDCQAPKAEGINGTPPYMAPEMLQVLPYDTKVDVWSLGVIVYVLLFGDFPYKPAKPSGQAMKAAILAGVPEPTFRPKYPMRPGEPGVSEDGLALVRQLLRRGPEERPSAAEVLTDGFFCKVPNPGEDVRSLRPMLSSAKRIGLFDVRSSRDTKRTDMDVRLAAMQERRRPGAGQDLLGRKGRNSREHSSEVSTEAGGSGSVHSD